MWNKIQKDLFDHDNFKALPPEKQEYFKKRVKEDPEFMHKSLESMSEGYKNLSPDKKKYTLQAAYRQMKPDEPGALEMITSLPGQIKGTATKTLGGGLALAGDILGNEKLLGFGKGLTSVGAQDIQEATPQYSKETSPVKHYVSSAVSSIAQQAPGMVAGLAALPVVGPVAAMAIPASQAGLTEGLGSYGDFRNANYTPLQSFAGAVVRGGSEFVGEMISGKIGDIFKPGKELVGKSILKQLVTNLGAEITGEEFTTLVQAFTAKATLNPEMTMGELFTQIVDTAIVTPVQAGAMTGAGWVAKKALGIEPEEPKLTDPGIIPPIEQDELQYAPTTPEDFILPEEEALEETGKVSPEELEAILADIEAQEPEKVPVDFGRRPQGQGTKEGKQAPVTEKPIELVPEEYYGTPEEAIQEGEAFINKFPEETVAEETTKKKPRWEDTDKEIDSLFAVKEQQGKVGQAISGLRSTGKNFENLSKQEEKLKNREDEILANLFDGRRLNDAQIEVIDGLMEQRREEQNAKDPQKTAQQLTGLKRIQNDLRLLNKFTEQDIEDVSSILKARAEVLGVTADEFVESRLAGIVAQDTHATNTKAKGSTTLLRDGRSLIKVFKKGNMTTVLHEFGHVFRKDLDTNDTAILERVYKVRNGKWGVASEEKFARDFEAYMMEGRAPNKQLEGTFARLKEWFHTFYRSLRSIIGKDSLSAEVRGVMDRMLSLEQDQTAPAPVTPSTPIKMAIPKADTPAERKAEPLPETPKPEKKTPKPAEKPPVERVEKPVEEEPEEELSGEELKAIEEEYGFSADDIFNSLRESGEKLSREDVQSFEEMGITVPDDIKEVQEEKTPYTYAEVKVKDLTLAPKKLQYKETGNRGITNQFKDTKEYNPQFGKAVDVWFNEEDGKTYVVDGHHRVSLAQDKGIKNINVRYIKADSFTQARTHGALTNIVENKGDVKDAAAYFRDSKQTAEELKNIGVTLTKSFAEKGLAIAKLPKMIYDDFRAGIFPENLAVIMGQSEVADDILNELYIKLKSRKTPTALELTSMLDQIEGSDQIKVVETGLFDFAQVKTNFFEKAEISASILKTLGESKGLLKKLSNERLATYAENTGIGKIDTESATPKLERSKMIEQIFRSNTKFVGNPISNILNDYATKVMKGEMESKEANKLAYEEVSKELQILIEKDTTFAPVEEVKPIQEAKTIEEVLPIAEKIIEEQGQIPTQVIEKIEELTPEMEDFETFFRHAISVDITSTKNKYEQAILNHVLYTMRNELERKGSKEQLAKFDAKIKNRAYTPLTAKTFEEGLRKTLKVNASIKVEDVSLVMDILKARAETAGESLDDYIGKRFTSVIKSRIEDSEAALITYLNLGSKKAPTTDLVNFVPSILAIGANIRTIDTILHEIAHNWVFNDLSKEHREILEDHYGVKNGNWKKPTSYKDGLHKYYSIPTERFAFDFQAYLREGKAPTKKLETVFEKIVDSVIASMKALGRFFGEAKLYTPYKLDDKVRKVFDEMLKGSDEDNRNIVADNIVKEDVIAQLPDEERLNINQNIRMAVDEVGYLMEDLYEGTNSYLLTEELINSLPFLIKGKQLEQALSNIATKLFRAYKRGKALVDNTRSPYSSYTSPGYAKKSKKFIKETKRIQEVVDLAKKVKDMGGEFYTIEDLELFQASLADIANKARAIFDKFKDKVKKKKVVPVPTPPDDTVEEPTRGPVGGPDKPKKEPGIVFGNAEERGDRETRKGFKTVFNMAQSEEVKNLVRTNPELNYNVLKNEDTLEAAERIIKENSVEEVAQALVDRPADKIISATESATLFLSINILEGKKNYTMVEKLLGLMKVYTEQGRSNQALAIFQSITASGLINIAERSRENAGLEPLSDSEKQRIRDIKQEQTELFQNQKQVSDLLLIEQYAENGLRKILETDEETYEKASKQAGKAFLVHLIKGDTPVKQDELKKFLGRIVTTLKNMAGKEKIVLDAPKPDSMDYLVEALANQDKYAGILKDLRENIEGLIKQALKEETGLGGVVTKPADTLKAEALKNALKTLDSLGNFFLDKKKMDKGVRKIVGNIAKSAGMSLKRLVKDSINLKKDLKSQVMEEVQKRIEEDRAIPDYMKENIVKLYSEAFDSFDETERGKKIINDTKKLHKLSAPSDIPFTDKQRMKFLNQMYFLTRLTNPALNERIADRLGITTATIRSVKGLMDSIYSGRATETDMVVNKLELAKLVYPKKSKGWVDWVDVAQEYWTANVLSNPVGIVSDFVSTGGMAFLAPLDRGVTALYQRVFRNSSPQTVFYSGDLQYRALFRMLFSKEAWSRFYTALKLEHPILDESIMEDGKLGMKAIEGKKGKIIRTSISLRLALDEMFKYANRETALIQMYGNEILAKDKNLSRAELDKQINERRLNATKDELDTALREAKYRTFQKDLGKLGRWALRGKNETLAGRIAGMIMVPFIKTPTNLLKIALERTPLGIIGIAGKKISGDWAKFTQEEKDEAWARVIAGSIMTTALLGMAVSGFITGGGPDDPEDKDALYKTGWLPYSFKTKWGYFQFKKIEPFATMMGLVADFAELQKDMTESEEQNLLVLLGSIASRNILNKSFMSGVDGAIKAVKDPGRYGGRFFTRYVSGFVPFSGAVGSVAITTDPTIRDPKIYQKTPGWGGILVDTARDLLNAIRNKVPGTKGGLPAKLDIFGKPIEINSLNVPFAKDPYTLSKAIRMTWGMLSPFQVSKAEDDKVYNELVRMKFSPSYPQKSIKIYKMDVLMDSTEYWNFVELSGKKIKKRLDRITKGMMWDSLPDEKKKSKITEIVKSERKRAKFALWNTLSAGRKKEIKDMNFKARNK